MVLWMFIHAKSTPVSQFTNVPGELEEYTVPLDTILHPPTALSL